MARQFVEKWVLNTRDGSVNREIDEVRSGYPPLPISGYYHWGASQVYTCLLSVPSGMIFRWRGMVAYNKNDAPNIAHFYNGPSASVAATLFPFVMAGSGNVFVDNMDVPVPAYVDSAAANLTATLTGGLYGSNLDSNLFVRVQGILIASE